VATGTPSLLDRPSVIPAAVRDLDFIEDTRLYTPREVADILNTDPEKADFARKLLKNLRKEFPKGVLRIDEPKPDKRIHQQLRVYGCVLKIAMRRMEGR